MEKNWLEVYPWFKWGGNDNLPPFQVNQTFIPTELLLKEVGVLLQRNSCTLHPCDTAQVHTFART